MKGGMEVGGKKNILMILTNPFDPDVRVGKEIAALTERDYFVHLIAWDREGLYPKEVSASGYQVIRYQRRGAFGKGMKSLFPFLFFYVFVVRTAFRLKIDVVHCHDLDTLALGFIISKLRRTPLVYDSHETEYFSQFPPMLRKSFAGMEKVLSRRARCILVTNGIQRNKFRRMTGKKAEIVEVRNCPPLSFFRDQSRHVRRNPETVFGWVGYIQSDSGIDQAVEACQAVARGSHRIKVLLTGKIHQQYGDFKKIRHRHGRIRISVHPSVHYTQVDKSYARIDAAFMLYPGSGKYRYNTPTKLYESMARGIPVIATPIGDVREIVGRFQCGVIVEEGDSAGLVRAFSRMATDRNFRRKCGHRGFIAASRKYYWEIMASRLLTAYQKIGS